MGPERMGERGLTQERIMGSATEGVELAAAAGRLPVMGLDR